jgi:uncharacterized membrane protein
VSGTLQAATRLNFPPGGLSDPNIPRWNSILLRNPPMTVDVLELALRWLHILPAIALMGGTIFMRIALAPAANESLTQEQHDALRDRVIAKWKMVVHASIGLLLVTGFWNFIAKAGQVAPVYHMIMTVKILLGLGVMFIASALVGRSKGLEAFRKQRIFWMSVTLAMSVAIVLIAGLLKTGSFPKKPKDGAAVSSPDAKKS